MHSSDLEEITLLLIRDADEPEMWMDRWLVSYPTTMMVSVSSHQSIVDWQHDVQAIYSQTYSQKIAVVAHGAGVSAWLAWLYQADIQVQKRVVNMILVSPRKDVFFDDDVHTLQRVRCHCPTALVVGEADDICPLDWAEKQAQLWQARLLVSPYLGRLNGLLGGWQWGMKLMQEMLLR